MRDWHPLSKLVVLVGGIATAALLWFESISDSQPVARASVGLPETRDRVRTLPGDTIDLSSPGILIDLPPIDRFSAMVERPLFSPDRRPLVRPEPVVEEEPVLAEPEVVMAQAVAEPDIFFVGTVRRSDELLALITPFDDYVVTMLGAGEEINGWTVVEIGDRLLVLQREQQERRLSILE